MKKQNNPKAKENKTSKCQYQKKMQGCIIKSETKDNEKKSTNQ